MEKKIGKNVSSGAKKVETVERETAESVDPAVKKKTGSTSSQTRKKRTETAAAKEKRAAEERVTAAKRKMEAKEEKKEEKLHRKADLKQKKLEKKAALQQKKLERKALVAKKRAERKAKRLEKKAALKEKKVERRAERIARREMLRNESKAEKQKRIAREKKERIALKRQKREAREKARENKLKAREAARERRAEERRQKREQRAARKERERGFGGWLAAVISLGVACLALGTIVTAGAFRMNDMSIAAENSARATLFEMVSSAEGLDNSLGKLRVSSGANEQRRLLEDVLVGSAVMESALERIPVDRATSTDISDFVNRTSAYARKLLGRVAAGEALTETEKNTLSYLYKLNAALYDELNELATHMTAKEFRSFLSGKGGNVSDTLGRAGEGTRKEPEEIVDAPFSQHGNVGENRLSSMEEVTAAQAEEAVKRYLGGYRIQEAECTGETAAREMTLYNFVLKDEDGLEFFAQITKNGGMLAFFDTYETCTKKNFDLGRCDGLAKEFLESLGMEGMEAVWLSDGGMVADLTYVSVQDGVRVYPDMVRVRVCEEKGRVIGLDARGYLLNHEEREFGATMSEDEAKSRLSEELEPIACNKAFIPEGGGTLCYEFVCNYGEEQFIVYLDAKTGEEVRLFRVVNSARGNYLE